MEVDFMSRRVLVSALAAVVLVFIAINIYLIIRSEYTDADGRGISNAERDAENSQIKSQILADELPGQRKIETEVKEEQKEAEAAVEHLIRIRYNKNGYYEFDPPAVEAEAGDVIVIRNDSPRLQFISSDSTVDLEGEIYKQYNIKNAELSPGREIRFSMQAERYDLDIVGEIGRAVVYKAL